MLVIAHQMLNELAHTVRNDVHWGLLMSNDLRWFQLDAVLDPQRDLYTGAHMHPLGEAGNAAGDPAQVVLAADGKFVVALSGVGEIAVGREREFGLQRIKVGLGPVALAVNRQSDRAYVANRLSDSLSIVDLVQRQVVATVALGPKVKLSPADRGEQLFFSAELSHDGWMSCHSCHTDGHTNGLLNDNLSDGAFGAPKRVLSLLGREGTEPLAWDASSDQLEAQIRKSIVNTMQSDLEPSDRQVSAIAAYVRTLSPPPSLDRLRGTQDDEAVLRGQEVFHRQQCGRCHAPPTFTTPRVYDVGLADKQGGQRFNPPSLLGVSQRGPYFHDNRAKTLEDVFTEWRHPSGQPLEPGDRQALISFLRSL
jgi:YVTN family beta-propeller protein